MNAIRDLKLDDVLDDLRSQATKRIDEFITEGRKQARHAGGGHDDIAVFSAFAVGILAGIPFIQFAGVAIIAALNFDMLLLSRGLLLSFADMIDSGFIVSVED